MAKGSGGTKTVSSNNAAASRSINGGGNWLTADVSKMSLSQVNKALDEILKSGVQGPIEKNILKLKDTLHKEIYDYRKLHSFGKSFESEVNVVKVDGVEVWLPKVSMSEKINKLYDEYKALKPKYDAEQQQYGKQLMLLNKRYTELNKKK